MCRQACPKYPKNKFAISLQYLKNEMSDEVDYLHAGKHETLLQSMVLMGTIKHSQSSQNSKFMMFLKCLKKEENDKVYFLFVDKH